MRAYIFIYIAVAMQILFLFAGINTNTGFILSHFGLHTASDFTSNSNPFWGIFDLLLIAVAVAGVIPSFIGGIKFDYMILGVFISLLLNFVADFYWVMTYANAHYCPVGTESGCWVAQIIFFIMLPMTLGFLFSIVSFWFGRD